MRKVSRRPQLRSLLDQQRTLGNRAVLRLIGVEPGPQPEAPPTPVVPAEPAPPPEPPPGKRRWFGALGALAILEGLRRCSGG